jgi:lipoyl(octanoyl) transferase
MGEAWYRSQGIDVVPTRRGGRLTYHGPGQLVGYPIMRVDDLAGFVHAMERAIVSALAEEGIEAHTREGIEHTGAWVGDRKIASIGVHRSRGVTMHGFAVNVDNDLQPFEWVVACGLPEVRMTSVCAETGRSGRMRCFRREAAYAFARELGRRQRLVTLRRLEGARVPSLA